MGADGCSQSPSNPFPAHTNLATSGRPAMDTDTGADAADTNLANSGRPATDTADADADAADMAMGADFDVDTLPGRARSRWEQGCRTTVPLHGEQRHDPRVASRYSCFLPLASPVSDGIREGGGGHEICRFDFCGDFEEHK